MGPTSVHKKCRQRDVVDRTAGLVPRNLAEFHAACDLGCSIYEGALIWARWGTLVSRHALVEFGGEMVDTSVQPSTCGYILCVRNPKLSCARQRGLVSCTHSCARIGTRMRAWPRARASVAHGCSSGECMRLSATRGVPGTGLGMLWGYMLKYVYDDKDGRLLPVDRCDIIVTVKRLHALEVWPDTVRSEPHRHKTVDAEQSLGLACRWLP